PAGRELPQPGRRHPPRHHQLPRGRRPCARDEQGRQRDTGDRPGTLRHGPVRMTTPLLEMREVTKEYRGVAAVKTVSFTLIQGEIHALVGENGAGKSTLTKMMAGVVEMTSGTMLFEGRPIAFKNP